MKTTDITLTDADKIELLSREVRRLETLVSRARGTIIILMGHLPDSNHPEAASWVWCWEELSSDAQDVVKEARRIAEKTLNKLDGE